MIQRIQSLYLLLVAIVQFLALFVLDSWPDRYGSVSSLKEQPLLMVLLSLSALFAIISLLKYRSRKTQFVWNRLNLLIHLTLLALFVIRVFSMTENPQRPLSLFVPIVSIVLLFLANKAIKKDEELIRSVDRLR